MFLKKKNIFKIAASKRIYNEAATAAE